MMQKRQETEVTKSIQNKVYSVYIELINPILLAMHANYQLIFSSRL